MRQLQDQQSRDLKLLTLYRERKDKAVAFFTPQFNKFLKLYNIYRQSMDERRFANLRNFVQVHYTLAIIEADVAQKMGAMFGTWPYVEFQSTSSDDVAVAKKNSTLVSAQLDEDDTYRKAARFFLEADIYGTAIARLGWEQRGYNASIRIPTPTGGEQKVTGYITTFDGPTWDVVPFEDFWPEDGALSIAEAKYCFHRYPKDLDDIRAGEAAGIYRKGSAKQLENTGQGDIDAAIPQVNRNFYRDMFSSEMHRGNKFDKRITCVDMVGDVPDEFVQGKIKKSIVTIANDRVIIREVPFPFEHGRLDYMFFAYSPLPDTRQFHGIGKAEVAEKMQYLINRYASQKADAVDLSIQPMWLVNELGGVDYKQIATKSGNVIKSSGPVDDSNIRPFSPDLRGIPLADNEQQQLWEMMQIATGGIQDVGLGGEGPNRETATSAGLRSQRSQTRQMLEINLAEKGFIEKLAMAIRADNRQFLPLPKQLAILGSEAVINPLTGLPLPQEPTQIGHYDVAIDLKARAVGSTQMLGKQVQQQNALTLLQVCGTNPVAVQTLNWNAMFRYIFKTFDVPNVNEFFVQVVPQVNQQASQAGVDPNAVVNNMASTMDGGQMSPEMYQYLHGGPVSPYDMGAMNGD